MSKHTPGKWFSTDAMKDIFDGCTVIVSEEVDDAIICSMGGDMAEAEANARLIASAPALLEALKGIAAHSLEFDVDEIHYIAADAIKLAEGE